MANNIGVTVVEVDGRSSPTITAAPTGTAGFLVRSERGAPDLAVRVRGFADFAATFGRYTTTAYGAFAVRGFFDNGGSDAYVVRVVGAGAAPATVTLADRASTPVNTLTVRAGARGRPDPGAWGSSLTVAVEDNPAGTATVPAHLVGANTEPFALADGNTAQFTVTTRGVSNAVTVTFRTADFAVIAAASAQEVAAVINRQTTAVRAGVAPSGRLVVAVAATDPRVWSRLQATGPASLGFTGAGANSDAAIAAGATVVAVSSASGFRTGAGVRLATRGHVLAANPIAGPVTDNSGLVVAADGGAGQTVVLHTADFANPAAPTIAEAVAAINRQAVAFTAQITHDNRLALLSNTLGTGSTIAVSAPAGGIADARTALGFPATPSPVAGVTAFRTATAASETYRLVGWDATPALPAMPAAAATVSTVEFDLVVRRDGTEVERFRSLSMVDTDPAYVAAVVNDPRAGSAYVIVTDLDSASGVGLDVPAAGA
ncbi:MAG: hypothetical protein J2P15_16485, partial [Micromonosporaceae bacterium]|nr:hypothetical protein [Micromonosporaceae bacterium]